MTRPLLRPVSCGAKRCQYAYLTTERLLRQPKAKDLGFLQVKDDTAKPLAFCHGVTVPRNSMIHRIPGKRITIRPAASLNQMSGMIS